MTRLPIALQHEPLVESVFEVRFQGAPQLSDILPGYLLHEMQPRPTITRLPLADIPLPLRQKDPNLRYQATHRVECNDCSVTIGDLHINIGSKLPYPKWPSFRATILDLVKRIAKARIPGRVVRYSVKYVNLIPASSVEEQLSKIDIDIRLGPVKVAGDHVHLRVQRRIGDILHILSVITGASATRDGEASRSGVIVDIDSIRSVDPRDYDTFSHDLQPRLEELRRANKEMFFGCLRESTVQEMGPVYD